MELLPSLAMASTSGSTEDTSSLRTESAQNVDVLACHEWDMASSASS